MIRARYRRSFQEPDFMKPGKIYPLDIDLWSTSIMFNRGHKFRVDVTSSSAPGYDPNPNTEEPLALERAGAMWPTTAFMPQGITRRPTSNSPL